MRERSYEAGGASSSSSSSSILRTSVASSVSVRSKRTVTQLSTPALAADAAMFARRRRTIARHWRTPRTHPRHSLVLPQPIQLHNVAVVETQVPQTAAVEFAPAGVQQPRKILEVRSSANKERRTQIQRAIVTA